MRWHLAIHHPEHQPRFEWFDETRQAWFACEAALATLEAEGFVRREFDAVEYGVRWLGRLVRGASEATVELVRVDQADTADVEG
jgi:hypothetical protein